VLLLEAVRLECRDFVPQRALADELGQQKVGKSMRARHRQPGAGVRSGARGLGPAQPGVLHHEYGFVLSHACII
jgi:hypothetical protein